MLALTAGVFAACYFLPVGRLPSGGPVAEALHLTRWYAREHVLLCLVPAFFIAGGIAVFVSQASVMKYLGARANKILAYGVASVSGSVLAVCSCTVLPLFAGIWRMGAGLGPATAFLYAGPAINVLAIVLTARVLGLEMGIARTVGAVGFSVIVGLLMHLMFRKEELAKAEAHAALPEPEVKRPLWKNASLFGAMVGLMVFANWAQTGDVRAVFLCCPGGLSTYRVEGRVTQQSEKQVRIVDTKGQEHRVDRKLLRELRTMETGGLQDRVHRFRWVLVAACALALAVMVGRWIPRSEGAEWVQSAWGFAKQILPLLLGGVLVSGFLLGRPGREGLIPSAWISNAVGGNSLFANFVASLVGAFMYFATLTEVPIVQGLLGSGMGQGPALTLLLAGPALSLPSMLVIRSILGTKKTVAYIALVVVMATVTGMGYGWIAGKMG
jgi:hypothetical protein